MNSWVVVWGDVSGRSVIDAPSSAPGRTGRASRQARVGEGWPGSRTPGSRRCVCVPGLGAWRWRGVRKTPVPEQGAIAIADPLSRRSLCRSWHLTRSATSHGGSVAGCRASQGRFPPPLWIRQSSVVGEDGTSRQNACQGNPRRNDRGRTASGRIILPLAAGVPDARARASGTRSVTARGGAGPRRRRRGPPRTSPAAATAADGSAPGPPLARRGRCPRSAGC